VTKCRSLVGPCLATGDSDLVLPGLAGDQNVGGRPPPRPATRPDLRTPGAPPRARRPAPRAAAPRPRQAPAPRHTPPLPGRARDLPLPGRARRPPPATPGRAARRAPGAPPRARRPGSASLASSAKLRANRVVRNEAPHLQRRRPEPQTGAANRSHRRRPARSPGRVTCRKQSAAASIGTSPRP